MSVVRIPKPDEDAFPWPRVVLAVVAGGALGLGIAWCGMETDRSADLDEGVDEPAARAAAATEPDPGSTPLETGEGSVGEAPAIEPSSPDADLETPVAPDATATEATATEATATEEAATEEAAPSVPADPPREPTVIPVASAGAPPASAVTLRRGRVAYLRCDGVPPREGPFPCPRDEPLEAAVWSAISAVEGCARSPGPGQADLVVDLAADGAPAIRTRDTFPPDTARTDDAALLACTTESLGNVRSSLSPRRLVVSFRLTLDPAGP